MGSSNPPVLHTSQPCPLTRFNRLHTFLYSGAILSLLHRHLSSLPASPSLLSSSLLLLSDLVLALMWLFLQAFRWRPVRREEHPHLLLEATTGHDGLQQQQLLPALDVFICTADPYKEPPASVASTALSVMAYDYPAEKISVYVSDDGGSELTLFAFVEAARFARHWLPFCKENAIDRRSPDAYFSSSAGSRDGGYGSEKIKLMYQSMKEKVESTMEKGFVSNDLIVHEEDYDILKKGKGFTRRDHPSIVQVLLESGKDCDINGNAMPNLIYVSREKSSTSPHNFKAGALNALLRVSSVMTNAPILLTLDCDMCSNDPQAPQRALCYLLDPSMASELSFVQFPQRYRGLNRGDIYGGELRRLFRINSRGLDGLCGPNYVGTGCFFVRRSLFGPPPSSSPPSSPCALVGVDHARKADVSIRADGIVKKAHEVAGCQYELGTTWGSMIGFRYGSLVEDYHTGYRLHCEGWRSVFCDPERPAFLGDSPRNLNDGLSQCRRWVVGLYEVAFSRFSPLTYGTRKASFPAGLCYAYYAFWGTWCIPITTYALIPQLGLIYDTPLFPKVSSTWFYLYAYLFLASYCHDLIEFMKAEGTIRRWWSDQRMWMIRSLTSFSFGTMEYGLNQMGVSAPGFSLTSKVMEDEQNALYDKGVFYFGVPSPFFAVLGTVAIMNLGSLVVGVFKATRKEEGFDEMFMQLFISGFAVLNCLPVIEAMFIRRDGGKIPRKITNISILLAGLLCSFGYFIF